MASRGRVEASEDKRRSLNAFCVASPARSDLADACFQSQTLERFQRETPVGCCSLPPSSALWLAEQGPVVPLERELRRVLRDPERRKLHTAGSFSERDSVASAIIAGFAGITRTAHTLPGPVWGAAFGRVSTVAGGLRALCWTGSSQHVVTVLNCWFSKQCFNPKACSPGAFTMTVYPHRWRRFFQKPRLQWSLYEKDVLSQQDYILSLFCFYTWNYLSYYFWLSEECQNFAQTDWLV